MADEELEETTDENFVAPETGSEKEVITKERFVQILNDNGVEGLFEELNKGNPTFFHGELKFDLKNTPDLLRYYLDKFGFWQSDDLGEAGIIEERQEEVLSALKSKNKFSKAWGGQINE